MYCSIWRQLEKTRSMQRSTCLAALLTGILSTAGCSIVGFAVGSAVESGYRDSDTLATTQLSLLTPGRDIVVLTSDESRIQGEFVSLDSMAMADYCIAYNNAKLQAGQGWLPGPNDRVRLTFITDRQRPPLEGTFAGFDPGVIRLELDGKFIRIPTAFVDSLYLLQDQSTKNCILAGEMLLEGVPSLSKLNIDTTSGFRSIPLDQVRYVYLENSKPLKWVGLGIGALFDGLWLYLTLAHSY
jgi:hypothetical protein